MQRIVVSVSWAGLQWNLASKYSLALNGIKSTGASCFNGYFFVCGSDQYNLLFPSYTSGKIIKNGFEVGSIISAGRGWEIEFCGESVSGKIEKDLIQLFKGERSVATVIREGYLAWSACLDKRDAAFAPAVIALIFLIMTE